MPRGRAPEPGERFVFQEAGATLRKIAATKGEAFYRGEIAEALVAHAKAHGGAMTLADLANFQPEWVTPIQKDFAGHTVHEIPPNGQGIAALMALGMLSHFDIAALPLDGSASFHLQIEAMKLAFADVYRHVAERGAMQVTTEQLLDDAYLASRAKLIDPQRAQDFGPGEPPRGGTIYLSAADEAGLMVSFIQSNYMGFGSGVVLPEWGLSLQNRGHGFSLRDGSANLVAPGKRPFHTIIPGFLTQDGQPVMSFGVMGGDMQPQGHLQTLVRMLDYGQNPQTACCAPRWRFNPQQRLNLEHGVPEASVLGLKKRGHVLDQIDDSYQDFGAGQFIWRLGDPAVEGYAAASDARRDGLAAGF
jgi:gamma-glutamyltranspeptidase/glutathione hydrolase